MLRTFANIALVLIGLSTLALGGILLLPGPTLAGPSTFSLPVGIESTISLRIQNQSMSVLQITRVDTSCGCLEIDYFSETVAPFSTGVIEISSTPLKSQWGETQTVQVVLPSGRVLVTSLTINPEPIWPSFPEPIQPVPTDAGDYVIQLNPAYASVIERIEFDIGGAEPLIADWDPESASARVEPEIASSESSNIIFIGPDGETPIWAERIHFPRE